jgi:uncharacterized protein YceK
LNISRLIALLFVGLLSGCSSLINDFSDETTRQNGHTFRFGGHGEYCANFNSETYTGTKKDMEIIDACINHGGGISAVLCLIAPFCMIDLPFTIVADTLVAPITLVRNAQERGIYRNYDGDICRSDHDLKGRIQK